MKKILLLMLLCNVSFGVDILPGKYRVIDGDTVHIDTGKEVLKIRLEGIDAPERGQQCTDNKDKVVWACGKTSGAYLKYLIEASLDEKCRCFAEITGKDKYKRSIGTIKAKCKNNTRDLNAKMVASGWAVAYTKYTPRYSREHKMAQTALRGIWRSSFQLPEEYRKCKTNKSSRGRREL